MLRFIMILAILVSMNFNTYGQIEIDDPYKERREMIGRRQVFKTGLDTYDPNSSLKVDIVFPQTVVFFALISVDDVHFLPLPKELQGKFFGEFWWTGNIHRHGYCKIEINLNNEKFLVCTQNDCYTLEISKPKESVTRRTIYVFTYRNTKLVWDEEKRELVNILHKAKF